MEEIRRTKIKEAMKETLNVYEKLALNMTEIEIVSRSQNVAAKVAIAKKQLETEAEESLEKQQTPMKQYHRLLEVEHAVVGISTSQKSHRMMQQDMLRELR